MKPFRKVKSIPTPLSKVNIDTDQIIPKQFLKLVQKTGFGKFLFYNWRFNSDGQPDSSFVLNNPLYQNSKILVVGDNFGCGSSREHAVWALMDYGFEVVIAPSFADIFYGNCFKNGLLPIRLDQKDVDYILSLDDEIEVDLELQQIRTPSSVISFEIDPYKKKILLEGLDDIALTLRYEDKINQFEKHSNIPSVL